MSCDCCTTAKVCQDYRLFNPACQFCGARLIQRLGTLPIAAAECRARRTQALADWLAHGHNEAGIRALVKGPLSIGPDEPKASAPQAPAKRR